MMILLYLGVAWYLAIAATLFRTWLGHIDRDDTMTPSQRWMSWILLAVSTILWFFSLPMTYLELLKKQTATTHQPNERLKLTTKH
jgi:putative copper export protein